MSPLVGEAGLVTCLRLLVASLADACPCRTERRGCDGGAAGASCRAARARRRRGVGVVVATDDAAAVGAVRAALMSNRGPSLADNVTGPGGQRDVMVLHYDGEEGVWRAAREVRCAARGARCVA